MNIFFLFPLPLLFHFSVSPVLYSPQGLHNYFKVLTKIFCVL